jgi:hypothetical protein
VETAIISTFLGGIDENRGLAREIWEELAEIAGSQATKWKQKIFERYSKIRLGAWNIASRRIMIELSLVF